MVDHAMILHTDYRTRLASIEHRDAHETSLLGLETKIYKFTFGHPTYLRLGDQVTEIHSQNS